MKTPKINKTNLKARGVKDTVQFGIKDSGLAHIFNVLRNQLYTDKILAVIREYSANAIDANVDAGKKDIPILVTLPTMVEPRFKVRDVGCALTQKDIHDIYAMYGESTKRDTNTQIGMLGIGSKSAFAYGDNFVINSFVDGTKHSYNAFIDPSQVGQISKLLEEPTDEEDGLEVIVPVNEDDVEEFQEKAYDLFKLFKIKPKVVGGSPELRKSIEDSDKVLFAGDDWEFLLKKNDDYSRDRAVAIMGNIGYPIDRRGLGYDDDEAIKELLNSNIRVEFEIGELEIAANREGLQYTDFTKKNIIDKLEKVRNEMGDKMVAKFDGCKTLFETKQLYFSLFDLASGLHSIRDIVKHRINFNGVNVTNNEFKHVGEDDAMKFVKYEKKRTKYHPSTKWKAYVKDDTVFVHNDSGHRRGALAKVLPIMLDDEKDVYIVEWSAPAARKAFEKETGFDAPMLKMSELEKGDLSKYGFGGGFRGSNGKVYNQNPQNLKRVLELDNTDDASHERDGRSYATSWKETKADIENGMGVYVEIDRYKIVDHRSYHDNKKPHQLIEDVLYKMEQLGIEVPTIIGVKKSIVEKINKDNWISLREYLKQELDKLVFEHNVNQLYNDEETRKEMDSTLVDIISAIKGSLTFSQGAASKLANTSGKSDSDAKLGFGTDLTVSKLFSILRSLDSSMGVTVQHKKNKDKTPLELAYKNVVDQYPLLDHVETWGWKRKDKTVKAITDYINIVDLNNVPAMLS